MKQKKKPIKTLDLARSKKFFKHYEEIYYYLSTAHYLLYIRLKSDKYIYCYFFLTGFSFLISFFHSFLNDYSAPTI